MGFLEVYSPDDCDGDDGGEGDAAAEGAEGDAAAAGAGADVLA